MNYFGSSNAAQTSMAHGVGCICHMCGLGSRDNGPSASRADCCRALHEHDRPPPRRCLIEVRHG